MDFAVTFEDVYKEYPFYQHITAGFKSFLFNLPKNLSSFKQSKFLALSGVSFEVRRGETFGIIGRNGSGKSTILSLIAEVIRQDRGTVTVHGKVSSLLELGSGFHPDLSGIENIILNGILMGNTRRDMLGKIDEIVDFSELGDFIYQPLRTYSSGMHIRLGFSVAVHIDPEILLIDEALAVGDISFQKKCMKKMIEFKESGATIVMVSHDMTPIAKLCDRVAWIDSGKIMALGKPVDTIKHYTSYNGQAVDMSFPEEDTGHGIVYAEGYPEGQASTEVDGAASRSYSWWESPLVVEHCEKLVTGQPDISFYDFLRTRYISHALEKGLSIGRKLPGLESNFASYDVCRTFDGIYDEDSLAEVMNGSSDFKEGQYDLFFCTDILHRIKTPDTFLEKVERSLVGNGMVIAFEYIGPEGYRHTSKTINIAELLLRSIGNGEMHAMDEDIPSALRATSETGSENEKPSPNHVISSLKKRFEVKDVRYCGGPLYDLVVNRILQKMNYTDQKDVALLETILHVDQVLTGEGILPQNYAVIIAQKR